MLKLQQEIKDLKADKIKTQSDLEDLKNE